MDKINKIKLKYKSILDNYKKDFGFNGTILNNFIEFNYLFLNTLDKAVNKETITIDKRDEYDMMLGILGQISGEYGKLEAKRLKNYMNIEID